MTPETIDSPHNSKECQLSVLKKGAESRACKLTRVINNTNQITIQTLTDTINKTTVPRRSITTETEMQLDPQCQQAENFPIVAWEHTNT